MSIYSNASFMHIVYWVRRYNNVPEYASNQCFETGESNLEKLEHVEFTTNTNIN